MKKTKIKLWTGSIWEEVFPETDARLVQMQDLLGQQTNLQAWGLQREHAIQSLNAYTSTIENKAAQAKERADEAYDLAEDVKTIALGATSSEVYHSYATMCEDLLNNHNTADTSLAVGQHLLIVQLDVPDLWISQLLPQFYDFEYTDDTSFLTALKEQGFVRIGWYAVSALETQKVDLTDYYNKSQIVSLINNAIINKHVVINVFKSTKYALTAGTLRTIKDAIHTQNKDVIIKSDDNMVFSIGSCSENTINIYQAFPTGLFILSYLYASTVPDTQLIVPAQYQGLLTGNLRSDRLTDKRIPYYDATVQQLVNTPMSFNDSTTSRKVQLYGATTRPASIEVQSEKGYNKLDWNQFYMQDNERNFAAHYTTTAIELVNTATSKVYSMPLSTVDYGDSSKNTVAKIGDITAAANNLVAKTDTTDAPTAGKVAKWGLDGKIYTNDPVNPTHCVNLKYAQNNFVAKSTDTTQVTLYGNAAGTPYNYALTPGEPRPWSVPQRGANGIIYTGTPTENGHAATKGYVDSLCKALFSAKYFDIGDNAATSKTQVKLGVNTMFVITENSDWQAKALGHTDTGGAITDNYDLLPHDKTSTLGGYYDVKTTIFIITNGENGPYTNRDDMRLVVRMTLDGLNTTLKFFAVQEQSDGTVLTISMKSASTHRQCISLGSDPIA